MTRAGTTADNRSAERRQWHCYTVTFCLLALMLSAQRAFASTDIDIILSANTPYYLEVADTLKASVLANHPSAQLRTTQLRALDDQSIDPDSLVVAIGSSATEAALKDYPQHPLLSLFVTESAWHNMIARQPYTTDHRGVIFINQPLERQLALALLLKPDVKRVSTVFGPVSRQHAAHLQHLAQSRGLELLSADIDEHSNPLEKLTPLIISSDLFLAIPEQSLFNRTIARWALYLSYKQKIPVLGFSRAYTQAGALASLYSSPGDLGRQAGDWLSRYIHHDRDNLWGEFSPRDFTLDINPSVARALKIRIASEEALQQQLVELLSEDQGL